MNVPGKEPPEDPEMLLPEIVPVKVVPPVVVSESVDPDTDPKAKLPLSL